MNENTSGAVPVEIPQEIRGWNWGAFLMTWIWGIGNSVWIALLCLIPCVYPVMVFVLGFKGSEWAWRAKKWASVAEFKRVQRIWAWAGLAVIAFVIILSTAITFFTFSVMKQSDAYKMALSEVKMSSEAVRLLGAPIEPGWYLTGNINVSGSSGTANISFPVSGPKAKGTVHVNASKVMDKWQFNGLALSVDKTGETVPLLPQGGGWEK